MAAAQRRSAACQAHGLLGPGAPLAPCGQCARGQRREAHGGRSREVHGQGSGTRLPPGAGLDPVWEGHAGPGSEGARHLSLGALSSGVWPGPLGWRGHSRWHNPTDFAGVPLGLVDPWACHCVTKTCKDWLRTGAGLVWAVWPRAGGPQSPGSASPASRISDQVTGAQGSWKERRHWGAWTPVTRERVLPAARGGREGVRSCRAGSSGGPPGELWWPPGPLLTRSPRQR